MALVPLTKIQIQQRPSDDYPDRNDQLNLNFVIEAKIESSWATLTDTAKVTFPKNIVIINKDGTKVSLGGGPGGIASGAPIIAATGSQTPILLRGDQITITGGFGFLDKQRNPKIIYQQLFKGYIAGVKPRIPIELSCEDNMWLLKQVQAPNQIWPASLGMEGMIQQLLAIVNTQKGTNLTLGNNPQGIETNIGDFRTQNETVCGVLARLQKDYKIESYFRGDTLYCGTIVYYPNNRPTSTFILERNILPDHSLEYTRVDDINICLKAYAVNKLELETLTKNGRLKTKKTRLEVTVTVVDGKYVATTDTKKINNSQMRTMYFWNVTSMVDLTQKAINMLHRFYYEGFRGKFTTLGLPYVEHGDTLNLQSVRLPEWNSTYFVKSVNYELGIGGWHQTPEIDLKTNAFTADEIAHGL